jgi:uridine kinase
MQPSIPTSEPPRLIALTGGSGSGKSWLALRLQAQLGPDAALISLDDFYRDLGHLPPAVRDAANFDDPEAIDWEAVRTVMDCLANGGPARIPAYDFATHTRLAGTRVQAPVRFVLIEGLWLLHHPWLRDRFALGVFVECPDAERMRRRIERDVLARGRTEESVRTQFEQHVRPMHERFVEPQRHVAGLVVCSPLSDSGFAALMRAVRGECPPLT